MLGRRLQRRDIWNAGRWADSADDRRGARGCRADRFVGRHDVRRAARRLGLVLGETDRGSSGRSACDATSRRSDDRRCRRDRGRARVGLRALRGKRSLRRDVGEAGAACRSRSPARWDRYGVRDRWGSWWSLPSTPGRGHVLRSDERRPCAASSLDWERHPRDVVRGGDRLCGPHGGKARVWSRGRWCAVALRPARGRRRRAGADRCVGVCALMCGDHVRSCRLLRWLQHPRGVGSDDASQLGRSGLRSGHLRRDRGRSGELLQLCVAARRSGHVLGAGEQGPARTPCR